MFGLAAPMPRLRVWKVPTVPSICPIKLSLTPLGQLACPWQLQLVFFWRWRSWEFWRIRANQPPGVVYCQPQLVFHFCQYIGHLYALFHKPL